MIKNFLPFIPLVILSIATTFAANRPYQANIRVKSTASQDLKGIRVTLYKIKMTPRPGLELIQSGATDEQGSITFAISSPNRRTFYRVSAVANDIETGSDPFRPEEGQSSIDIVLTLPTVSFDVDKLDFQKDILLIEPAMDIVRITEIVYLTNGSDSVIDATKFPIVIKIPVQATNVVVIQSPKNSAIETEGDKIRLKAKLPLGHSQIVFRYDFVSDGSDISFTHTLLPQLETQELVVLQSGVSVDFNAIQT